MPKYKYGHSIGAIFKVLQKAILGGGHPKEKAIPQVTIEYIDRNYVIFVNPLEMVSIPQEKTFHSKKLETSSVIKTSQIFAHELNMATIEEIECGYTKQLTVIRKYSPLIPTSKLQIIRNINLEFKTTISTFETIVNKEEKEIDISSLNIVNKEDITFFVPTLSRISENSSMIVPVMFLVPVIPVKKSKSVKRKEIMDLLDSLDKID